MIIVDAVILLYNIKQGAKPQMEIIIMQTNNFTY